MRHQGMQCGLPWLLAVALGWWGAVGLGLDAKAQQRGAEMKVESTPFGQTEKGEKVTRFVCTNQNGCVLELIDYGAIVLQLRVPDRQGRIANVNLGFESLDGYLQRHPYFGATVGRFCNRIAGGQFSLDGKTYTLAKNNGPNHLHGGVAGFDKQLWKAEPVKTSDAVGVRFSRQSPDGEEGYPGCVDVSVLYTLNNRNELLVDFTATTDQPTPLNLTNHNYWNLAGAGNGSILDHELEIAADQYVATNDQLIPTGKLNAVANTPLDFRMPHRLGERIRQIVADPVGYDHCYVLRPAADRQPLPAASPAAPNPNGAAALRFAARVTDRQSGRVMEVYTTQPGLQLYSGNFLDGSAGNGGYKQYEGFCLETQHFPDSPNQPGFANTILKPGETFRQTSVFRFTVK